jgi:hypothetical protein
MSFPWIRLPQNVHEKRDKDIPQEVLLDQTIPDAAMHGFLIRYGPVYAAEPSR